MRESIVENKVCEYARLDGWLTLKFSSPGRMGVPDRMFLRNTICFFVEFKMKGKKPTKLQNKFIEDIRKQGFEAFCVNDVEYGKNIIDSFGDH